MGRADAPQPPQKYFESLIWHALRTFDPSRPVFVESESRKIGAVQVHGKLIERMRAGQCLVVEAPFDERVKFLQQEYRHFLEDPTPLKERLACLVELHGHEVINRWLALAEARDWNALVPDLLAHHYDPAYQRSTRRNFRQYGQAGRIVLERLDRGSLERAASALQGPARLVA